MKTYSPEEIQRLDYAYMDKRDIQHPPKAYMGFISIAIVIALIFGGLFIYGLAYFILSIP